MDVAQSWRFTIGATLTVLLLACHSGLSESNATYDIKLEDFQVSANDIFQFHLAQLTKFNRTTIVINATATVFHTFPEDATLNVVAYEERGNGFGNQATPIYQGSLCEFMENPKMIYMDFQRFSNLPEKCPVEPGEFWVRDYKPDTSKLPSKLPGERWRIDAVLTSGPKTLGELKIVVYIKKH